MWPQRLKEKKTVSNGMAKKETLGKSDKTDGRDEEGDQAKLHRAFDNQHMDLLLAHGVNRQQRHSDMSSCVWTDRLKV